MTAATVRIGCLGAARIVPAALTRPASRIARVEVSAIAARDRGRAEAAAKRFGIPTVHAGYDELLADDSIDAVYIPLPNGLHGRWTLRALEAGKHVLCEKPFTANAQEARAVEEAAAGSGRVVMEAFHWRYHPLAARMLQIVGSGELGAVRRIEVRNCFPLPRRHDIRWDAGLAGGAMMDAGCYAVHIVRTLAGAEPKVTAARARLRSPGVDRCIEADFTFDDGRGAWIVASMWSAHVFAVSATVVGDDARLHVFNPLAPQYGSRLTVRGAQLRRHERAGGMASYAHQLEAFRDAIVEGAPVLTPPADAVANMQVIDDVYLAAGLEPRAPTA